METFLYIVFTIVCLVLVVLVLIQQGKGAGVGFSMGGASQAMFGGSGGRDFFIQLTSALAVVFMVICIILAKMATSDSKGYHGAMADVPAAPAPASAALPPALPNGMHLNPAAGQAAPLAAQPLKAVPASRPQSAPVPAPQPAAPQP